MNRDQLLSGGLILSDAERLCVQASTSSAVFIKPCVSACFGKIGHVRVLKSVVWLRSLSHNELMTHCWSGLNEAASRSPGGLGSVETAAGTSSAECQGERKTKKVAGW